MPSRVLGGTSIMQQQTGYVILSWFYITITLCLVINRLYVRALRRTELLSSNPASNWSDALVIVAWCFNLLQSICDTIMYSKDAMVSESTLDYTLTRDRERIVIFEKIYYAENVIYYVSLYCIKGAILCFLLEVTPPVLRHIRRAIWVGISLSGIGLVMTVFIYMLSCQPISYWWDHFSEGDCVVADITLPLSICFHLFTDVYIYTIPFFLIRKLTLISRSQRLATGAMFGAGFILVGFAVPQMLCAWVEALWNPVMWSFWCCLHEQALAVTVACLPALRVTVQRWRKRSARGGQRRSMIHWPWRGELATREVAVSQSTETKDMELCKKDGSFTVTTLVSSKDHLEGSRSCGDSV